MPLVFVGLMMFMFMRQSGGGQAGGNNVFSFGKSKARKVTADQPSVKFDDVAGVEEAKEELAEVVEFLQEPREVQRGGCPHPQGGAAGRALQAPARR